MGGGGGRVTVCALQFSKSISCESKHMFWGKLQPLDCKLAATMVKFLECLIVAEMSVCVCPERWIYGRYTGALGF